MSENTTEQKQPSELVKLLMEAGYPQAVAEKVEKEGQTLKEIQKRQTELTELLQEFVDSGDLKNHEKFSVAIIDSKAVVSAFSVNGKNGNGSNGNGGAHPTILMKGGQKLGEFKSASLAAEELAKMDLPADLLAQLKNELFEEDGKTKKSVNWHKRLPAYCEKAGIEAQFAN